MSNSELAVLRQISTLTKVGDIVDQKMLRKLLIEGKAYSPQEGYVVATTPIINEDPQLLPDKEVSVWETRTPKPKSKGDQPIPYEFCAYTKYAELPSDILRITRETSFTEWIEHNGYKYKRIAGGVMRRPIS
ncbi:MAG: hypothetical protein LBC12_03660 [Nitrososphaerota archaeon]|jgi:hypothetical protein|nr:hypothetical protein [Nitrososphaerota archaeon]